MSRNYIINFVDNVTGDNIDTVSGRPARYLMKYSELLRTLHEIDPSETTFTIPINMPYGRLEIFKKILKGYPVAEFHLVDGEEIVTYKPLSAEEEAIIADEQRKGTLERTIQEERERVIFEVLSFLMIDPDMEHKFITYEDKRSPENKELVRRRNITRRRRYNVYQRLAPNEYAVEEEINAKAIPFLNEDKIEELIEKHKDYLYGIYRPRYYSRVRIDKLLNKKDIDERNKKQEEFDKRRQKEISRRRRRRRSNNYHYNWPNSNSNNGRNDILYNVELLEEYMKPFKNVEPHTMSSREFERYLRSLRREGEEKYLPYQGPLVGNLFGNQSNV